MAGEVLIPTSTVTGDSNLTGNHLNVDDDPDSPGGDWRTASSNNANSVAAHGFDTPTGNPTTGAGLQNFKIYARLTANATACTYNVYVRESGTRLNSGSPIATGSLTSTTGQLITANWDASLLGTADGSLVECEFEVVKSGGAPGARTTGEVDAIEWNVEYSSGPTSVATVDSATAQDTVAPAITASVATVDSATAQDSTAPTITASVGVAESITAQDSTTLTVTSNVVVAESITGQDAIVATATANAAIVDSATGQDVAAPFLSKSIGPFTTLALTATMGKRRTINPKTPPSVTTEKHLLLLGAG